MHWYFAAWKKFAVIRGRASRMEYLVFTLMNVALLLALHFVDSAAGLRMEGESFSGVWGGGPLVALYSLAVAAPSTAVVIRRLHDTNRSGWWLLLVVIPFLGPIALLILLLLAGDPSENGYGPNPQAV